MSRTFKNPSEAMVQDVLYRALLDRRHAFVTPNVQAFSWEDDLVSVSRHGLVHSFEIKTSRKDLWKEVASLDGRRCPPSITKQRKHQTLVSGDVTNRQGRLRKPSYWWLVVTPAILAAGELPHYAGLVIVGPRGGLRWARSAPAIHRTRADQETLTMLGRGLMLRYWNERGSTEDSTGLCKRQRG